MFASSFSSSADASTSTVLGWIGTLAGLDRNVEDEGLIEQIRVLEELKSATAGAQARAAVALDISQRKAQAAAGVPAEKQGQDVGAQIALARRESPYMGSRLLGLARALVAEMPHTLAALEAGVLNEWRATILVRETACLALEDRRAVDEELAADTGALEGFGNKKLAGEARRAAYRLDPESAIARARHAVKERHVSCRPAPDTMTYLTGLLPVAQGVAVYAALSGEADARRAVGDERGRGQIMADTLVERVTGAATGFSSIEIQLVMTDRALLQGDSEPAYLAGYGIVPAQSARNLIKNQPDNGSDGASDEAVSGVWLRKLYTAPATGQLVGMDSRARFVPPGLRRWIQIRDATCRTPYCDAPIRHADHVIPWSRQGQTSEANIQGLCERCNQNKEAPGWSSKPRLGPRHAVETRTPTGHTYRSTAPPLPGTSANSRAALCGKDPRPSRSAVDTIRGPVDFIYALLPPARAA